MLARSFFADSRSGLVAAAVSGVPYAAIAGYRGWLFDEQRVRQLNGVENLLISTPPPVLFVVFVVLFVALFALLHWLSSPRKTAEGVAAPSVEADHGGRAANLSGGGKIDQSTHIHNYGAPPTAPFHAGPILFNVVASNQSAMAKDRTLTDWQVVRLTAALAPHPGQKIAIVATPGAEAQNFANQLRAVFLESGWCVKGPLPAPKTQPAQDMQISLFAGYFAQDEPPPAYLALKGAFDFLGLRVRSRFIADPNVPPQVIALWVGAVGPPHLEPDTFVPLALDGPIEDKGFESSQGPVDPIVTIGALPDAATISDLRARFPDKDIVDDDPRAVMRRIFASDTGGQQPHELIEAYVGKWMALSFLLGDYQDHFGEPRLLPVPELVAALGFFTYYYFGEQWREVIASLKKRTTVAVLGKISHMDASKIVFRECELLEAEQ